MVYNVVLCGGVGSRLWPLSRKSNPKQYLKIFNNKSLFQLTAERNAVYVDGLITVGNELNNTISKKQLAEIDLHASFEIVETIAKNTAPAIAFAALSVNPDDVIFVTPSDHLINNDNNYSEAVSKAIELANEGNLVTFGITPDKAETGFGYIHFSGNEVLAFIEKPNLERATQLVNSGNYLWNSGMFCFKASVFLEEFKKYSPEMYDQCLIAFNHSQNGLMSLEYCQKINGNSIDYAIMEKTQITKVIPSNIKWSDLGSYAALWEYYELNNPELIKNGNLVLSQKHVEIEGIEGVILVDTDDALLLIPRDKTQDVKRVYERIEKNKIELL